MALQPFIYQVYTTYLIPGGFWLWVTRIFLALVVDVAVVVVVVVVVVLVMFFTCHIHRQVYHTHLHNIPGTRFLRWRASLHI